MPTEQEIIGWYRTETGRDPSPDEIKFQIDNGGTQESIRGGAEENNDTAQWNEYRTAQANATLLQTQYLATLRESMNQSNDIATNQLGIANEQQAIAREQYDYYKKNFLPLEEGLIAQAKEGINENEAAGSAERYVRGAYDSTQGALDRNYQRLGIDVSDPDYAKVNQSMDAYREAAVAGAKNDARYAANEATKNMQLSVSGMGRGIPASSLAAFNTSSSSLGQAAANTQAGAAGVARGFSNGIAANAQMTNAGNAALSQSSQLRAQTEYARDVAGVRAEGEMAGAIGGGAGIYMAQRDWGSGSNNQQQQSISDQYWNSSAPTAY